jgi:ketosteroid isomerase-like protein
MRELVAPEVTDISLNYGNKDLKAIMPWVGTSKGPQAFIDIFSLVFHYWDNQKFEVKEIFGTGENVAVFGSFTYKSNTLGKVATSPFSIWAKVKGEKIAYFRFMEDTYSTAATFKVGGACKIHSDPEGKQFEI